MRLAGVFLGCCCGSLTLRPELCLHSRRPRAQVSSQQRLILDQQAKLRLQEEVIASLKDRLKERIDEAMQHVVPGTVCEKMVAAVKATLYGAKDMQGLQVGASCRMGEVLVITRTVLGCRVSSTTYGMPG